MEKEQGEYLDFLKEYVTFFEGAADNQAAERDALRSNDLPRIERVLAKQQAVVMKMDLLEKQRLGFQERAGFGGLTFRQIVEKQEGDSRKSFQQLFARLEEAVYLLKANNEQSIELSQSRITLLEKLMPEQEEFLQQSYSSKGKRETKKIKPSVFETQV